VNHAIVRNETDQLILENQEPCPKFSGSLKLVTSLTAGIGTAERGMFIAQIERDIIRCGWTPSSEELIVAAEAVHAGLWSYKYSVAPQLPDFATMPVVLFGFPTILNGSAH
jgi:hypothetical protein